MIYLWGQIIIHIYRSGLGVYLLFRLLPTYHPASGKYVKCEESKQSFLIRWKGNQVSDSVLGLRRVKNTDEFVLCSRQNTTSSLTRVISIVTKL